jgi:hypothetical protein
MTARKFNAVTGVSVGDSSVYDVIEQDGSIKSPVVDSLLKPKTAEYTYTGSNLTRIDYADGTFKDLTYTGSTLTRVEYTINGSTWRKDFTYDLNSNLTDVTVTKL